MAIVTQFLEFPWINCDYSHTIFEVPSDKLWLLSHIFKIFENLGKIVTIVTHIFDFSKKVSKMTFLENFFWCALKLSDRAPKPLVRSYWSMRFF